MRHRLLGANLKDRGGHRTLSSFDGRLLPHDDAPTPKPTWTKSASMPHIVHAEGGRGGAEDIPDKLEEAYEENTAKYTLTRGLGLRANSRANGETAG